MKLFSDLKFVETDTIETLNEKIVRNEKKAKLFLALSIVFGLLFVAFGILDIVIKNSDLVFTIIFTVVGLLSAIVSAVLSRFYSYLKRNNNELLIAKKKLQAK